MRILMLLILLPALGFSQAKRHPGVDMIADTLVINKRLLFIGTGGDSAYIWNGADGKMTFKDTEVPATTNLSTLYGKMDHADTASISARIDLKANAANPSFTGVITLALHTLTAGDSVFGKTFVNAADTTLVFWNGTAWITIQDLAP